MKPYDPSTDYGSYPTLAPLPEELTGRFARCEGCGGVDFRFRLPDWTAVCKKCGAKLALPAQKPASKLTQTAPPPKVPAKRELSNIQIVGASEHTVLLRPDGTVRARGNNYYGQCNVSDWSDIVAISAVSGRTTGLRRDGTVVIVGENSSFHNVSGWSDITAICTSGLFTAGLRRDGTVLITGNRYSMEQTKTWSNITQISVANNCLVGRYSWGNIVTAGFNCEERLNVKHWSRIRAIAPGLLHLLGLRENGTVVAAGDFQYNRCEVKGWTNITALSASYCHSVGLRADGTVVATGKNGDDCCNVQQWTNVAKIWALPSFTAAMQHDGTILCTNPAMKQWILDALS